MYCPSCGAFNTDSSKFCKKCGVKLPETQNISENNNTPKTINNSSTAIHNNPSRPQKAAPTQNGKNSIASARKKLGTGLIIAALVLGLGGVLCSTSLSNSYKPITVRSGYRDPNTGETEIYRSYDIGGNYEAVSYYDSMKWLFIIGEIIIAVAGICIYSSGTKYENLPLLRKHGHVVGVDGFMASIEFDDGERSRLPCISSKIVLVNGDKGMFDIKENKIIAFEREV